MSKFKCENPECSKLGILEEELTNTYTLIEGKLVSDKAVCPVCGKYRTEINENQNIPISEKNINYGKYSSLSSEDKRKVLSQRSKQHFKSNIKEEKEFKIANEIKKFNSKN